MKKRGETFFGECINPYAGENNIVVSYDKILHRKKFMQHTGACLALAPLLLWLDICWGYNAILVQNSVCEDSEVSCSRLPKGAHYSRGPLSCMTMGSSISYHSMKQYRILRENLNKFSAKAILSWWKCFLLDQISGLTSEISESIPGGLSRGMDRGDGGFRQMDNHILKLRAKSNFEWMTYWSWNVLSFSHLIKCVEREARHIWKLESILFDHCLIILMEMACLNTAKCVQMSLRFVQMRSVITMIKTCNLCRMCGKPERDDVSIGIYR